MNPALRRQDLDNNDPDQFGGRGSALESRSSPAWRVGRRSAGMDKDRVIGSAKVVAGKAKEAFGKVVGDAKLRAEGAAEQIDGKVQNAIGGIKETLKGK